MIIAALRAISKNKFGLGKRLKQYAEIYLDLYHDYDYDFDKNGESVVVARLARFAPKTVFDVGANVGEWSLVAAAAFPQACVHAFELSAETRATLRRNLSGARHVVADCALGRSNGSVRYKDYGHQAKINTLISTSYHDASTPYTEQTAALMTGDQYMQDHGISQIDFLKIDVEGAEFQVLEGFQDALKNHRIRVIQFEYGYANGDAGHLMKHFHELLSAADYEIGKIWTAGVLFAPFDHTMNNFDVGPNYLAVARTEPEIIQALRSPAP